MIVTYKFNKLPLFIFLKPSSPLKYIINNTKIFLYLKNTSKNIRYNINIKKIIL